jgi:hypothetical protein
LKTLIASIVVVGAIAFGAPYLWQHFLFPEDTIKTAIDVCSIEADKIYTLEITKWAERNNTNAFNAYKKGRDKFTEDCVERNGRWCVTAGTSDVWPCPWVECFLPTDAVGRWLWNQRNKERAESKCR